MCKCTPEIRTPFCGKPGCEWPPQVTREQPSSKRLVQRLRSAAGYYAYDSYEAANEIERLRAGWDADLRSLEVYRAITPQRLERLRQYRSALHDVLEQNDLTCMRSSEEISVAEGCPCANCVAERVVDGTPSETEKEHG
jgi:hypothetical protein